MALEGTLREFGLADILQLIGIQRKSGILTLQNGDASVELRFLEGNVVGAESAANSMETRLGQVLVRSGKITEAQLEEALRLQKRSLQRLGHVLVKNRFISAGDLEEALRVQSLQVILALFRWRDGTYRVRLVDDVDHDETHFSPISSETILMEGARMVDEWPIIERRIPSAKIVFERTEATRALQLDPISLVDAELDFSLVEDEAPEARAGDPKLTLTEEERQVLTLVDGIRSVEDICDYSTLGEFDTYRTLSELLTRDMIRQIASRASAEARKSSRPLGWLADGIVGAILAGLVLWGLASLGTNPFTPWRIGSHGQLSDQLRSYASRVRLEQIERAVRVYYLDNGSVPEELAELAGRGYLRTNDLLDPWGRAYGYRLSTGGYELFGLDAHGGRSPVLSFSRRFSAVEQQMGALRRPPGE